MISAGSAQSLPKHIPDCDTLDLSSSLHGHLFTSNESCLVQIKLGRFEASDSHLTLRPHVLREHDCCHLPLAASASLLRCRPS